MRNTSPIILKALIHFDVVINQVLCEYNVKLAIYADSSPTQSLSCYSRGNRNRFIAFSTKDRPNNLYIIASVLPFPPK